MIVKIHNKNVINCLVNKGWSVIGSCDVNRFYPVWGQDDVMYTLPGKTLSSPNGMTRRNAKSIVYKVMKDNR